MGFRKYKMVIGKIVLVVLIILGLGTLGVGIFVGISYYQATQVMELVNDNSLKEDVNALANGDCSKLPTVELKLAELESKVNNACGNFLIKMTIASVTSYKSLCDDFQQTTIIDLKDKLEKAKAFCKA